MKAARLVIFQNVYHGPWSPLKIELLLDDWREPHYFSSDNIHTRFINNVLCTDKYLKNAVLNKDTRIPFERCREDVAFRFVVLDKTFFNRNKTISGIRRWSR